MPLSAQYTNTSLQYTFSTIDVDLIVRNAFLRCGIKNYEQDGIRYADAKTCLDFVLSDWPNHGLNLFTVIQYIIPIVPYQFVYSMPFNTSKILDGILVTGNDILGGTATSSAGGVALNAFTYPFTYGVSVPCTQTSINGNISYLYTTPQPILYVGIETYTTQTYTLSVDCSFLADPGDGDWINVLNIPAQLYYFGMPLWVSLPTTYAAVNWRIRESGGATLNIAQIYLNIPKGSQSMNPQSREDNIKQSLNISSGTAATYWFDRVNPGVIRIYGTPTVTSPYDFFVFNCVRYIQDCGTFQNSIDANSRFIEPATAGLAAKLAIAYAPDRYEQLFAAAQQVYQLAGQEDTENVPSQARFSLDGGFA
jgi:hypothetical protein